MTKSLPKTDAVILSGSEPCRFRSAYSPRVRVALSFPEQGRTKQSFKDECDINRIMKRYALTGTLDFVNQREARFMDVTSYDYQEAMNMVAEAKTAFEGLPSAIRSRFKNDPAELLAFLEKPHNRSEAIELGLVDPTPHPTPTDAAAAVLEPSSPIPASNSPAPAAKPMQAAA